MFSARNHWAGAAAADHCWKRLQRARSAPDTLLADFKIGYDFENSLRRFTAKQRPSRPAPNVAKVAGSGVGGLPNTTA